MPRRSWLDFVSVHPRGHLVVLSLVGEEEGFKADTARRTISRLINQRVPDADFALTIVRQAGKQEIHVAFADEAAAATIAGAFQARRSDRHDGWASQATAELDPDTISRLAAAAVASR